jgi:hypothetical protein
MLTNGKSSLWAFIGVSHQILDFLVVDLNLREVNFKLHVLTLLSLNSSEDLIACNRDNTNISPVPNHGVTLACPCLAISE